MEETKAKVTPTFRDNLNGQFGSVPLYPFVAGQAQALPQVQAPPIVPIVEVQELQVALIGTAPSSRLLAPYHDPAWQIWACSPGNMNGTPRVDAWFEIHGNLMWEPHKSYGEPYLKWLSEQKFPVYMQITRGFDARKYVPNALRYPMEEMVEEFGPYFFQSSFAWMIAFALSKKAKKIALYGIDMASPGEYIAQRPSFYFWLGEAQRRGCEITAPFESDLMQPMGLYGFSECTPRGRKILAREQELDMRLNAMRQQVAQLQHNIHHLEGAREDNDYHKSIWIAEVADPYGAPENTNA